MTESAAWLFQNALTTAQRSNLLHELFATNNGGIGLSICGSRSALRISACRITPRRPTRRQTDYGLTNFSISHDTNCILPILREIRAINTNIALMAPRGRAGLDENHNQSVFRITQDRRAFRLRRLFAEVCSSYAATGLPIAAITLQNEPLYEPWGYPGTYMGTNQQVAVAIRVGQLFQSNGVSTRILCYDHNWDQFNYPITVLNNTTARQISRHGLPRLCR
jgi:glucosylceramidase